MVYAPKAITGLIWLVGLSHATNHLVMLLFPAVLLLVQSEFSLSYVELGLLANAGLLCYGSERSGGNAGDRSAQPGSSPSGC